MTAQREKPPSLRTLRLLNLLMGTSMLLWVPCAVLSLCFFVSDRLYVLTVFAPDLGTGLVEVYRGLARELEGTEGLVCKTRFSPAFGRPDERDLLVRVMERAEGHSGARRLAAGSHNYSELMYDVEELDLALFRRGMAIEREHTRGLEAYRKLEDRTIYPFCDAQTERQRRGEPLLPPIEVYAQSRAILLDAAQGMEVTLARYAEVRPWLLAFFYAWIGYSLIGLGCAIYGVRLGLRRRANARLQATSGASASNGRDSAPE